MHRHGFHDVGGLKRCDYGIGVCQINQAVRRTGLHVLPPAIIQGVVVRIGAAGGVELNPLSGNDFAVKNIACRNTVRHGISVVVRDGRDRDVLPLFWGNRGLSIGQIARQDGAVAT